MSSVSRWFRQARPAGWRVNLGKTAAQTVVFWGFFLWVCPVAIAAAEDWLGVPRFAFPLHWLLPWKLFALAGTLGLWSGATMAIAGRGTPLPVDCPRRLVVAGPYAHVRNPMAIAGLTQGAAVGLALGSFSVLIYTAAGALIWNLFVRPTEEAHLEELFGGSYRDYRHAVRCWLPSVRAYQPGLSPFSRNRVP
ncbi:MAG: isoprenylcysteine carboxylmethyltransferase family protein [Planctomycetota bacterium]